MPALVIQAVRFAKTRPARLRRRLREYWRFYWNSLLARIVFGRESGVLLERNVRLQRLSALLAERPSARIRIGADSVIYEFARIEAYGSGTIEIGPQCIIGDARIYSRGIVRIGARVITSWNVLIQDFDPHPVDPALRARQVQSICEGFRPRFDGAPGASERVDWTFEPSLVEIGDDVWLGANTTLLKGARIGKGSVVAAGSVVTAGDWPENSILAGQPARVVKMLGPS